VRRGKGFQAGRVIVVATLVVGTVACRQVTYEHEPTSRVWAGHDIADPSLDSFRVGPGVVTISVAQDTWGDHNVWLYVYAEEGANMSPFRVERLVARTSEGASHELPVLQQQVEPLDSVLGAWFLPVSRIEGALHDAVVDVEGDLTIEVTARFDSESKIVSFTLPRRISWWVVPP